MPRLSEGQQYINKSAASLKQINESSVSLNRLRQYYILLVVTKSSKKLINTTFKVYALQYINYVKLVNNQYLKSHRKNRI